MATIRVSIHIPESHLESLRTATRILSGDLDSSFQAKEKTIDFANSVLAGGVDSKNVVTADTNEISIHLPEDFVELMTSCANHDEF